MNLIDKKSIYVLDPGKNNYGILKTVSLPFFNENYFKFKQYDDIDNDKNLLVVHYLGNARAKNNVKFLYDIITNEKIINLSKQGKVVWLFHDNNENINILDSYLYEASSYLQSNKIIFTSGSNFTKQQTLLLRKYFNINVLNDSSLLTWIDEKPVLKENYFLNKLSLILNKKVCTKKSICYTHRLRLHRVLITAYFLWKEYENKIYLSFLGTQEKEIEDWIKVLDNKNLFLTYNLNILEKYIRRLEKIVPEDDENLSKSYHLGSRVSLNHGYNSYFHIVLESFPDNYSAEDKDKKLNTLGKLFPTYDLNLLEKLNYKPFITEKSTKPLVLLQPFIIFGNPYQVKGLRNYGFKTFDKWINHSYDIILNNNDRMQVFLKELDRLMLLSDTKWNDMLIEMLPDLIYNYKLYMQLRKNVMTYNDNPTNNFNIDLYLLIQKLYYE